MTRVISVILYLFLSRQIDLLDMNIRKEGSHHHLRMPKGYHLIYQMKK